MQILVGLGNPGQEYERTRHNVGQMALDVCRQQWAGSWKTRQENDVKATTYRQGELLLVKPQTFMNESGETVRRVTQFFKVDDWQSLYVLHDDLDLELGRYKVQLGTGPKVHNGLNSIYDQLGTQKFWHVRIGVDGRAGDRQVPGREYVLQTFQEQEREVLDRVLMEIADDLGRKLLPSSTPSASSKPQRTSGGLSSIQDLFAGYQLEDKGGYITQEFQDFGYRLAVELNDMSHKSLYIKMAKEVDRSILEQALSFVSDAQARNKARLFMWKVKELKKNNA